MSGLYRRACVNVLVHAWCLVWVLAAPYLQGYLMFFFQGTAECQQIFSPLSELPRAERDRDRVDESSSVDGWMNR